MGYRGENVLSYYSFKFLHSLVSALFNLQGMAVVAARATRLPIYSSFAKEGNLSDIFAKGEAISTLSNVIGLGAGIQLASTFCSSMQGKVQNLLSSSVCHFHIRIR